MDLSNDHEALPARTLEIVATREPSPSPQAETMSLSALWAELVSGVCKVEDTAFTEQSCALVVSRDCAAGAAKIAMSKRHVDILERSLIDGARKSVAVDLGLCPSSVAEILKQGFNFMGLSCWPSRIPLLLVMAAHAQRTRELDRWGALVTVETSRGSRHRISVKRPDHELASRLTPAEYAVLRLLVEGKSYAEMAGLRETSTRTVANQLAAAFRRLGVSGRAELLCLLARRRPAVFETSARAARLVCQPSDAMRGLRRAATG